jgi:hypothetical protein
LHHRRVTLEGNFVITPEEKPTKQVKKPHSNAITAANNKVVKVDFKKRRLIVREP